jgi:hypothetical protein
MSIKHAFHSDISDGADTSLVRPSNWNADHVDEAGNPITLNAEAVGLGNVLNVAQEPALGSPAADGYVLSSDMAGARSWIAPGGGGAVSSVFGRTGDVAAQDNDYAWSQIDKTISSIADLTTKTHSLLGSLGSDDHTIYALLAGRAGGQTLYGGIGSGENLTLHSTAHATKGKIYFGANSVYDQANDRLGIGTTSPLARLDISSYGINVTAPSLKISGNGTYAYGRLLFSPQSGSVAGVINRGASATLYFGEDTDTGGYELRGLGDINVGTGRMVIKATSGNVGIGMTGSYKLDVNGTARATLFQAGQRGAVLSGIDGEYLNFDGAGDISLTTPYHSIFFSTNSSERMRIKDGNVGIGTLSPSEILTLNGAMSLIEMTAPGATAGQLKIFAQDNGAGKCQLMVQFPTGAAQEIKIEA